MTRKVDHKVVGTAISRFIGIPSKASFKDQDQKIRTSQFIQVFSRIAALLTSMLMITRSTESIAKAGKGEVGVGGGRHW